MADFDQIMKAARKAHAAGDTAAAKRLVQMAQAARQPAQQSPEMTAGLSELSALSQPAEASIDDLVAQAQVAFAAGDDAGGKALLTEANRLAIGAGNVPEGFVADPRTGGFSDIQNDPTIVPSTATPFLTGAAQGLGFNFADEAVGALEGLTGGDAQFATERMREAERRAQEDSPWAYYGGMIPGAIASSLSLGKLASLAGVPAATTTGGRVVSGALAGAGQGAAAGAGAGEEGSRGYSALVGALLGGAIGGAAPAVTNAVSRGWEAFRTPSALRAAAAGAPTTAELRAAGNAAYQAVDDAGVVVSPDAFARAVGGITDDMRGAGMWEGAGSGNIAPKSTSVARALEDVATDPRYAEGVPFSVVDTMRKVAGAPASDVTNKLESSLGMRAIGGLDEFVEGLTPDQVVAGNADEIGDLVSVSRGIWSKMSKSALIDDAMEKSQNYASGEASGLANRFRTILNSPKLSKGFTVAEKAAMRRVINGTMSEKALRYLGGGIGNIASMATGASLGSALGPMGSLIGAGLGTAGSSLARRGSEAIAGRNAEIVRALIANGGQAVMPSVSAAERAIIDAIIRGGAIGLAEQEETR